MSEGQELREWGYREITESAESLIDELMAKAKFHESDGDEWLARAKRHWAHGVYQAWDRLCMGWMAPGDGDRLLGKVRGE